MSADNFYLIRKHPLGGFAAVMGFASDVDENDVEIIPEASKTDQQFKTWQNALSWAGNQYAEYGVSVHDECYESKSVMRRVKRIMGINE